MLLSLRTLPRYTSRYLKQSKLHTSVEFWSTNNTNDSSSSSDSSSSDSDKEVDVKINKTDDNNKDAFLSTEKTNERLNNLLLKISQKVPKVTLDTSESTAASTPGTLNVAIKSRKIRFKKTEKQIKELPIEKQIVGAAKDLAKVLGGDSGKTELELLEQILNMKVVGDKPNDNEKVEVADKTTEQVEKVSEKPLSLSELLPSMKVSKSVPEIENIKNLKLQKLKEMSTTHALLHQKTKNYRNRNQRPNDQGPTGPELNAPCLNLDIFKDLNEESPDIPKLSTWDEMEKKEIKLATLTTPQNVFQELIQWTEEGKLWHFPINNEQGMEQEESIHFSEHVFLERHLKGWCPKQGPIRNFMELICIGLSKNPYMTVEEKIGHITWYKDYFEERKELLKEVGALGGKPPAIEKQIEA